MKITTEKKKHQSPTVFHQSGIDAFSPERQTGFVKDGVHFGLGVDLDEAFGLAEVVDDRFGVLSVRLQARLHGGLVVVVASADAGAVAHSMQHGGLGGVEIDADGAAPDGRLEMNGLTLFARISVDQKALGPRHHRAEHGARIGGFEEEEEEKLEKSWISRGKTGKHRY